MTVLEAGIACRYELDAQLSVVAVNQEWSDFAAANGAPELVPPPGPLGRSVLSYMSDPTTVHLYQLLFQRSRATNSLVTVPIRCDGPRVRRFLEVSIAPRADAGFLVTSTTLRREDRPPIRLLVHDRPHSDAHLTVCGWCKQVHLGHRWCEVEEALTELRLFEQDLLPLVSHGMCPTCYDEVDARLEV